jgi:hypothetical protein
MNMVSLLSRFSQGRRFDNQFPASDGPISYGAKCMRDSISSLFAMRESSVLMFGRNFDRRVKVGRCPSEPRVAEGVVSCDFQTAGRSEAFTVVELLRSIALVGLRSLPARYSIMHLVHNVFDRGTGLRCRRGVFQEEPGCSVNGCSERSKDRDQFVGQSCPLLRIRGEGLHPLGYSV